VDDEAVVDRQQEER